jgi:hypothetical protein
LLKLGIGRENHQQPIDSTLRFKHRVTAASHEGFAIAGRQLNVEVVPADYGIDRLALADSRDFSE